MSERRVIVDTDISAQQAEALAAMLGGIDERVVALEAAPAERTCRMDHSVLAKMLEGMDARIEAAVDRALIAHAKRLAHPEDVHMPPMAKRAAGIVSEHAWERFAKRFTLAILAAALSVLLAVGFYLSAKLGVLK